MVALTAMVRPLSHSFSVSSDIILWSKGTIRLKGKWLTLGSAPQYTTQTG